MAILRPTAFGLKRTQRRLNRQLNAVWLKRLRILFICMCNTPILAYVRTDKWRRVKAVPLHVSYFYFYIFFVVFHMSGEFYLLLFHDLVVRNWWSHGDDMLLYCIATAENTRRHTSYFACYHFISISAFCMEKWSAYKEIARRTGWQKQTHGKNEKYTVFECVVCCLEKHSGTPV